MNKAIKAIRANGTYKKINEKYFAFDVYGADEAFVTGTFGGLTPVINIDGRKIGNESYGNLTRLISDLYQNLIESSVKK